MAAELLMARGNQQCRLLLPMANRHGLIAGATGTGKTITVGVTAEQLGQSGVAVRRLEEEAKII
jgi:DNA helicase HerA-like ATPase